MPKCLYRSLFTPLFWIAIPYGSRTDSTKSASVTFAAVSLLDLMLEDSEVEGVCRQRCPDAEAVADVTLPDEVTFAFLFPFELSVSVVYDMTLFHSNAVRSGSVATTRERSVNVAGQRQRDREGDDSEFDDGDSFVARLRAEELAVGRM